jgi:hypothetical protein
MPDTRALTPMKKSTPYIQQRQIPQIHTNSATVSAQRWESTCFFWHREITSFPKEEKENIIVESRREIKDETQFC